ncbi:MAG: lasso peptide biosynthesis B2 protein [Pseudomonadota bacterium]
MQSLCVALAAPALMRIPLPHLDALFELIVARSSQRASRDPDAVAATVLDMLRAGRPLVRRGCLTRGLTLYYALRRAGVDVSLEFGMGNVSGGDGFDGHCWLVLDGKPYLEPRDPRSEYATMYCFGQKAAAAAQSAC